MTFTYGRRAARWVAIATVTGGFVALVLAAPSSADSWNEIITVDPCKKPWTQLCKNIPSWDTHYSTRSNVWITADPTHCSDIIARVRIDGRVVGSDLLGPGKVPRRIECRRANTPSACKPKALQEDATGDSCLHGAAPCTSRSWGQSSLSMGRMESSAFWHCGTGPKGRA